MAQRPFSPTVSSNDQHLLTEFPYAGVPISGYDYAPTGF